MTTIACDGTSMAGDGQANDHTDTIVSMEKIKVHGLNDGRIAGAAGNSFDITAWINWLNERAESEVRAGPCPIESDQFAGLILNRDGTVLWVDHKGREVETPTPVAVGSGQDYAYGAMAAGATAARAVEIATTRDPNSGGAITAVRLDEVIPAPPPGFRLIA